MKRTAAVLVLAAAMSLSAAAGAWDRELAPSGVRVAAVQPASSLPRASGGSVPTSGRLDLVFVASRCAACRSLVSSLRVERRRPCRGHVAVFVADTAWSDLSALAGDDVRIAGDAGPVATAFGIRATPTLVSLALPNRRVVRVDVGSDAVGRQFVVRPSDCEIAGR